MAHQVVWLPHPSEEEMAGLIDREMPNPNDVDAFRKFGESLIEARRAKFLDDVNRTLREFDEAGWELVAALEGTGGHYLYFARPA